MMRRKTWILCAVLAAAALALLLPLRDAMRPLAPPAADLPSPEEEAQEEEPVVRPPSLPPPPAVAPVIEKHLFRKEREPLPPPESPAVAGEENAPAAPEVKSVDRPEVEVAGVYNGPDRQSVFLYGTNKNLQNTILRVDSDAPVTVPEDEKHLLRRRMMEILEGWTVQSVSWNKAVLRHVPSGQTEEYDLPAVDVLALSSRNPVAAAEGTAETEPPPAPPAPPAPAPDKPAIRRRPDRPAKPAARKAPPANPFQRNNGGVQPGPAPHPGTNPFLQKKAPPPKGAEGGTNEQAAKPDKPVNPFLKALQNSRKNDRPSVNPFTGEPIPKGAPNAAAPANPFRKVEEGGDKGAPRPGTGAGGNPFSRITNTAKPPANNGGGGKNGEAEGEASSGRVPFQAAGRKPFDK